MKKKLFEAFRRNEIYVVATVIGVVFVAAMASVAWLLRSSIVAPPYETLAQNDLKKVFATGYLRFREDDKTPYLKLELHNGTLWWIKEVEFEFDGARYSARDADAFRPLHFGAVRCTLKNPPPAPARIEYDLRIDKAYGYPPVQVQIERSPGKISGKSHSSVQN
jgi:hypothetical protein